MYLFHLDIPGWSSCVVRTLPAPFHRLAIKPRARGRYLQKSTEALEKAA
jgi:hypothetical protein